MSASFTDSGIIQNIPAAAALVLPMVLVLTVVTNIIKEVLKKLTWGTLPTNILAFAVATAVTLLALFAACRIMGVDVTWYMVAGAIVLGEFVAYAAMFGRFENRRHRETYRHRQAKFVS